MIVIITADSSSSPQFDPNPNPRCYGYDRCYKCCMLHACVVMYMLYAICYIMLYVYAICYIYYIYVCYGYGQNFSRT